MNDTMTIKDVANVLNLDPRTVQLKAKELFPDKIQNGRTTYLNEIEVTQLKTNLEKKFEVTTDLEMLLMSKKVDQWKDSKIATLQTENQELKSTVNLLVHNNKTYTVSELSADLGFKSPQELNKKLKEMQVQYKVNGTWKLYSKYEGLNYTETKSGVSESGHPYYDMHWTGEGRLFLANLFSTLPKEKQLSIGDII